MCGEQCPKTGHMSAVGNGKQKARRAVFKEMIRLLTVAAPCHTATGPADIILSKWATLPGVFGKVKRSILNEVEAWQVALNHSA